MKYLDENGLLYVIQKIKTWLSGKANTSHTHTKSQITDYNDYSLPTATASTLGGVKVGTNLSINNGVLSATDTKYTNATTTTDGLMSSTDKTKLGGIETGANKTTIDNALNGSSTNPVQNKIINTALAGKANTSHTHSKTDISDFPTNVSAFSNDSGYLTSHQDISGKANIDDLSEVATSGDYSDLNGTPILSTVATSGNYSDLSGKPSLSTVATSGSYNDLSNKPTILNTSDVNNLISTAIGNIQGISYSIVASLPGTGQAGVIYLINNSGTSPNVYDEYIYVNNTFEKIGTTAVDLSDYVETSDLISITNAEIDTICA